MAAAATADPVVPNLSARPGKTLLLLKYRWIAVGGGNAALVTLAGGMVLLELLPVGSGACITMTATAVNAALVPVGG